MTYSATTVLPAEVCAETRTDSFLSIHEIEMRWNGSRVKGQVFAGFSGKTGSNISFTNSISGGKQTSCKH